jgi:hypothetical protein
MDQDKFDVELLKKIEDKKITPKPRWQFLLKDYVVWVFGGLSLIVGSLAVAVMIYLVRYNERDLCAYQAQSFWNFILLTLPYFWVILLGVLIFIIYYNVKHTKKGYKYPLILIVLISILASLIFGVIFYRVGLGRAIDDALGAHPRFYRALFNRQPDFWTSPGEGRLLGRIESVIDEQKFYLIDIDGKKWEIDLGRVNNYKNCELPLNCPIRLSGERLADDKFAAEILKPMGPGRRMMVKMMPPEFEPDFDFADCQKLDCFFNVAGEFCRGKMFEKR